MQIDFSHLTQEQGKIVNAIIKASLEAVDPFRVVANQIVIDDQHLIICGRRYVLREFDRIILIGVGKAVGPMAAAVLQKIGNKINSGVLVAKHDLDTWDIPKGIQVHYGSHPIPSEKSLAGAAALLACVADTNENDLIICLISGGGSALATKPINPLTITDIQNLTLLLLQSGANIQEINTVRKPLDEFKGGGIAKCAGNTPMETLILSDVLGDDISMIASGPTVADETTFEDVYTILQEYKLEERVPERIINVIKAEKKDDYKKTATSASKTPTLEHNHIVGSLSGAIIAADQKAKDLCFNTQVISTCMVGEAKEVGKVSGSMLRSMATTNMVLSRPGVMIGGGETTVTIRGDGKGGRNQEIAFGAIKEIDGLEDCALISIATDGEDGPTDAAGAYVTGKTLRRAKKLGLQLESYGMNNNTYVFFNRMGNLIKTGPTGTNVNDLLLLFSF